jgi:hypothetical protein
MLNFWQATLTTNSPSVSWKKRPTESLLHVTMVCFSKFNNTSTTPTSAPTFVQATLPDSAVPITICVLRQGVTDNQCVELFFDQSVTFSASGPHDIQLCGQIASASSSPSPPAPSTTRPTRTATSAKDSKQSSSDSDNDLDYQPGLDTGFGNSSSPSESDSESDHEALGKVLARDVVGGKRKANANVAAASQDKAKKPKNNKGSDSSGSSSSDSEDDANDNTQSVTPQNKQGSKASISEKLLQTLKSMNKARSGASSADIGTKYRDLHGKGFKEDASMKLMKFVKENGELFELTPGNLVKSASA